MFRILKSKKGFTLVEVIVVAVIVAILAAVAIPLYLGYVDSSKLNVANNTAASAASYLAAARNSGCTAALASPLAAGASWSYTPPNTASPVVFSAPDKSSITLTGSMAAGGTVICTYDSKASTGAYSY